jgi:uncharacterized protein
MNKKRTKIKVAALSDIHVKENSKGEYAELFKEISQKAEVLVLCGDLTDLGLPEQAEVLAEELFNCTIPVVGVLGNHDYAAQKEEEVKRILHHSGKITLLDINHDPVKIKGVNFIGVKGFGGGFDARILGPFGEKIIYDFVYESINEALNLEKALQQVDSGKKVIAMHYSPIAQTLKGEPLEIFPFLGCTRLLEPIERFGADVIFHGHAHHGYPNGKTPKGIPVYNVAYPLMQKENRDHPYLLVEV